MKKFRKIMAVLVAAVLMISSFTLTAFAAGDGSIQLDNAVVGEFYHIYKVFDLTYANAEVSSGTEGGDALKEGVAYTYTTSGGGDNLFTAFNAAGSPFTLTSTSTQNVYQVTANTQDASVIATWLKTNQNLLTETTSATLTGITNTGAATATTVKWDGLDYGYYYVTSSIGSTVTIDSTLKDVKVKDKNSVPSQDKKQAIGTSAPASAAGYADVEQQVQVGDKVWYQIEVTDGKGTDKDIIITDTMTDGLTFDDNITVFRSTYNSGDSTYGAESPVNTSNTTWVKADPTGTETFTFKVTLDDEYVGTLNPRDKVYIRFSATVNSKAASDDGADKESNSSVLKYSNQTSQPDIVDVVTYKFQLDKVSNLAHSYADLKGAKFELYRGSRVAANKLWFVNGTADNGTPVLIVVGVGASAPATPNDAFSVIQLTDSSVDTSGNSLNSSKVIIKGLDLDNYVLHETEAPAGYKIAADNPVQSTTLVAINGTITDSTGIDSDAAVVSIVNEPGVELPSTGGMGTTVLYIVGGMLVALAGAYLFFSRKKTA